VATLGSTVAGQGERHDTGQPASLRRGNQKEEFMMRNNVERLGEHVTAAFLGRLTP
jgi:hypothetical protein